MALEPDYYKILQVSPDADPAVIGSAFRSLMKKYHPDSSDPKDRARNEERAKEITEAHNVLKDPKEREAYDLRRKIRGPVSVGSAPIPSAEPSAVDLGEDVLDSEGIENNRLRFRNVLTSDAVRRVGEHWPKGAGRWTSMLQEALVGLERYDIEKANEVLAWFNDDCRQRRSRDQQA
jgi:curved DNA-binding protein CbpA